MGFQSTCLREARRSRSPSPKAWPGFQSTCLREARPPCTSCKAFCSYFNPRAYVRHDSHLGSRSLGGSHFNPRAYVRHDRSCRCPAPRRPHFNPRAYVRHDSLCTPGRSSRCNFNPRAYVRHDLMASNIHMGTLFQSTCLREARRVVDAEFGHDLISIHVPT